MTPVHGRRPTISRSRALGEDVPAAAGGAVMATGVVSVGLRLDGREALAVAFLVATAALWVTLAAVVCVQWLRDRARWAREAARPAALTAVAGTAVLGTALAIQHETAAAWALCAAAAALWAMLLARLTREWAPPTAGAGFLLTVAPQGIAVLLATLASEQRLRWPADLALVLVVTGIGLYVVVLRSFDSREICRGRGDQWILGGAAAITALAASRVHTAAVAGALSATIAWAAWLWSLPWLVVLTAAEIARPRPGYDVRRWATVFPVAMYGLAAFALGGLDGASALRDVARVWIWLAVAVWLVVALGAARRAAARAMARP